ncbi:MAG: hypothetical protein PHX45_09705 [Acidobacteriota bacterium]|nr:hypothetical protein [Acidobacteriota bacterium]
MKKIVPLLLAAAIALSPHAAQAAADEFQARLFQIGLEYKALKVRIMVDSYTADEEIAQIKNVLSQQGFDAFMNAFNSLMKGSLQIVGGPGVKINLHCAYSRPTDKGRQILLFTQAQDWDLSSMRRVEPEFQFMVIELNLNEKGRGNGKIYEQAKIRLPLENVMEMEGYDAPPRQLLDVREVKK